MIDYQNALLSEEKEVATVEQLSMRMSVETSLNFSFLNNFQKVKMVCSSWVIDTPLYFITAFMQFFLGVQLFAFVDAMSRNSSHAPDTWKRVAWGLLTIGALGMFFTALNVLRYARECWILIITEGCLRSIRQFLIRRTMLNRRSRVDSAFLIVAVVLNCICWMLIAMVFYGAEVSYVTNIKNSSFTADFFTGIHIMYCTFKHVWRVLIEAWREARVFKWPLRKWLYPCCECSVILIPAALCLCLTVYVVFIVEPISTFRTLAPTLLPSSTSMA